MAQEKKREDVEDDPRSGRLATSRTDENVKCVKEKVWRDCCFTVRTIADELGMYSERVWMIIMEDLHKNGTEGHMMSGSYLGDP